MRTRGWTPRGERVNPYYKCSPYANGLNSAVTNTKHGGRGLYLEVVTLINNEKQVKTLLQSPLWQIQRILGNKTLLLVGGTPKPSRVYVGLV